MKQETPDAPETSDDVLFVNHQRIEALLIRAHTFADSLDAVRIAWEGLGLDEPFNDAHLQRLVDYNVDVLEYVKAIAFPPLTKGILSLSLPAELDGVDEILEAASKSQIAAIGNFPVEMFGLVNGKVQLLESEEARIYAENTVRAKSPAEKELLKDSRELYAHILAYQTRWEFVKWHDVFVLTKNRVALQTKHLATFISGGQKQYSTLSKAKNQPLRIW